MLGNSFLTTSEIEEVISETPFTEAERKIAVMRYVERKTLSEIAVAQSPATVNAGAVVPMGRAIHKSAQSLITLNGDSLSVTGMGYYSIDVNVTFTGSAGDATIALYKDGYAVPWATKTVTIGTATTETNEITINALVLKTACKSVSNFTIVNLSSAALNVSSVSVRAIREC